jgi:hypothetical protein
MEPKPSWFNRTFRTPWGGWKWPWQERLNERLARQVQTQAATIRELESRLAQVTDTLDTIRNVIAPPWRER